jgi:hypothetical protein
VNSGMWQHKFLDLTSVPPGLSNMQKARNMRETQKRESGGKCGGKLFSSMCENSLWMTDVLY